MYRVKYIAPDGAVYYRSYKYKTQYQVQKIIEWQFKKKRWQASLIEKVW